MRSVIMASTTLVLVTWATWMCPLVAASLDNAENANCPTLGDENAMMQVQKLARIGNVASLTAQPVAQIQRRIAEIVGMSVYRFDQFTLIDSLMFGNRESITTHKKGCLCVFVFFPNCPSFCNVSGGPHRQGRPI